MKKKLKPFKNNIIHWEKQTPGDHESWRLINFMIPKNVSEYYQQ